MFIEFLAIISILIIFFGMIVYPKLTNFLAERRKFPHQKELPKITMIIPVYDEEKTIRRKLENTKRIDYPDLEIIVVDNGSSDKTVEIVKKYPVILLSSERGKVNAINLGIKNSSNDVIVISDSDVTLDKKALKSMVSHLTENIGAVGAFVESEGYRNKDRLLRVAESKIDSACNLDGKTMMFRKSVFNEFPKDTLTDDYSFTFLIRKKGLRLIMDDKAKIYEKDAGVSQYRRYAKDVIITNLRNINFLFNPKYGYFGMMTLPFRRFFPMFYPVFLSIIIVYSLILVRQFSLIIATISMWGIIFFGASFFRPEMLIQMYGIVLGYYDILFKRDLKDGKWETKR